MIIVLAQEYFNPRSHERSDLKMVGYNVKIQISIHAPTRGATKENNGKRLKDYISIHAPTRGATTYFVARLFPTLFQSTLPREERQTDSQPTAYLQTYFNPRSHERSDSNIAQKICLFLYNTDNKYIIR